jgi:alpha-1,2-mannosyltransferase
VAGEQAVRERAAAASRRRLPPAPRGWALQVLLVLAVLVLAEAPVAWRYLVAWPGDQWQVDVEVYREAARSVVYGRPIYEQMTEPPQLLPFTYPPFAALLALPLAAAPFVVVGWLWTALQVAATYATVMIVFRALLERAGQWRWLAGALVTAPMLWLHPVADGVRFGQVNAFIVLACAADLVVRRPGWARGALIGMAVAVKLTPGVFLVHLAWSRQWRAAATAVGAAAAVTVGAFLVLPEASLAFWGGALSDSNRLGPNMGTSNQSLRGFLLRLGPEGAAGTVLWLVLALAAAAAGLAVARRAHLAGDPVGEVAAMGLVAVLCSPVSWIHHFAWVVVVVAALVGDGRSRPRLWMGGVVLAWFLCRMPWWGITWVADDLPARWFGRALQNADTVGAVLALVLLARTVGRPSAAR